MMPSLTDIKAISFDVDGMLETDVVGARSAAVRSVWLNRDERERPPNHQAKHEVSSLRELVKIL